MGEVHGKPQPEFDFGNSPFEISAVDFTGKTIIQRTSAGTQGIVAAGKQAKHLYAAALVTADATVRAMLLGSPDQITLVAMGDNGINRTDEDEVCALHLRNRLEGSLATLRLFVGLSWPAARSDAFMIRPVRICTRRTWG